MVLNTVLKVEIKELAKKEEIFFLNVLKKESETNKQIEMFVAHLIHGFCIYQFGWKCESLLLSVILNAVNVLGKCVLLLLPFELKGNALSLLVQ